MELAPEYALDLFPTMQVLKRWIMELALAAARMIGVIAIVPVFRRAEMGPLVQGSLAIGFALPIFATSSALMGDLPDMEAVSLWLVIAKEVLVGLVIGLFIALPFWAFQAVGDIVDAQRSIGDAGIQDPVMRGQVSASGQLLTFVGIVLYVSAGGLHLLCQAIYDSYQIWPMPAMRPVWDGGALDEIAALLTRLLFFAVALAGPFVLTFLLSDLAVSGISRMLGRLSFSSMLPMVKNILFCIMLVAFWDPMMKLMMAALPTDAVALDFLRAVAPR